MIDKPPLQSLGRYLRATNYFSALSDSSASIFINRNKNTKKNTTGAVNAN